MERQTRLVHPHARMPLVALLTMRQSRSKTAGYWAFVLPRSQLMLRLPSDNHGVRELSLRLKCRINGLEQSRVAEWLEQALHGTLVK
jgi:hypothetical protein